MLETFADKVRVVFKNYPLVKSHKFAGKAALTAQAAHLQGKFWVVHDEFFRLHDQLNDEKIQEIVHAAGLNEEQLERDRNSPRVMDHVQKDLEEAYRLGVNSVPTVFVNGKRLRDRSFESLAAAVEKELKKNPAKK
ncbi:MAG: thioredoxin domain-containing protein [Deltaproteobacteria bacterium]|nr:thioredoxin domain-containing protein [Deltaproteobacteria bacterium]